MLDKFELIDITDYFYIFHDKSMDMYVATSRSYPLLPIVDNDIKKLMNIVKTREKELREYGVPPILVLRKKDEVYEIVSHIKKISKCDKYVEINIEGKSYKGILRKLNDNIFNSIKYADSLNLKLQTIKVRRDSNLLLRNIKNIKRTPIWISYLPSDVLMLRVNCTKYYLYSEYTYKPLYIVSNSTLYKIKNPINGINCYIRLCISKNNVENTCLIKNLPDEVLVHYHTVGEYDCVKLPKVNIEKDTNWIVDIFNYLKDEYKTICKDWIARDESEDVPPLNDYNLELVEESNWG